jgi:hypothetical protein
MPPLKTFKFQHVENSRIVISIDAYSLAQAEIHLMSITYDTDKYKLIEAT